MEKKSAVISIHNITKQEPDSPVTDSSSHQTEPIENRVLRKIIPMLGTDYCPATEDWANKFPDKRKNNEVDVNDIVSIIPCRGSLEQNRKMTVNVVFNPPRNILLKAVLECEVLGGPSETILITGQSSDMIYEINTHKLNYKIMSYHEKGLQKLIITNKALLPFEYRTYINTGTRNGNLTGFVADITPSEKRIEAYENIEINVEVSPGVVGCFTDTFQLELGCCPPIPIEVVGWGEIPQVYLTSQKHDQATLSEGFTYLAIATLTPEYLCLVKEIFYRTEDNEHLNTPVSASPTIEDLPEHEDWYIVSDEDEYPSLMDIELVIEKQLVIEHLRQRPEILPMYLTGGRTGPIPGFRTMPCTVDFGVVIIGTVVSMSVDITNYGPSATKPGFSKMANIPPFIGFKLCGKLMPGDVGKMDVRFSPTRDKFVELEQNYEETFNLGVPYGVTIPVVVRATCAVPYLVSYVTAIDFGTIKCGDKVVHKIPLKNIGKPACVWYATLAVKSVGAAAITIQDSSGVYDAGQEGWLSVAFRPSMEITYHGQLTLHFHLNPSPLTIPVRGAGVVPCVRVVGPAARFPPALPWAQPQHMYFGLMNPCNFPIELVFAHCDPKWCEEDKIYSLLMRYYGQPAELLVPRAAAGAALPAPLLDFYHTFTQRVEQLINEDSTSARKSSTTSKTKKSKSPRKMSAKTEKSPTEEISQRVSRTESEIISDVLKALKDENIDPLDDCFQLLKPAPAEDEKPPSLKGILIFFHGSPDQDQYSQEMAYSIGKNLQLPTITFDRAFADALCTSESGAKSEALSIIDELYGNTSARQSSRPATNVGASTVDANNEVGRNSGPADEVETIMMKLEVIWKSKAATPSKNRKKEGKGKAKNVSVATEKDTMFPLNLIQRLLTDYFEQDKYSKGFIVDNLNSVVIRTPTLVLMTVLKCKRSISNIHLVLCHSEFPAWAARYEQSLAERDNKELSKPKLYNEEEIKEIIHSIEEMTEEEFENVSSEIKSIYYEHGLAERKRRSIAKTIIQIKKREGKNRPKTVPIKPTTHDVVTNVDKKKSKKDEQKSARQTTEYMLMSSKFNDYANNTFESLLSVARNWIVNECEMGTPMKKRSPSLKKAKLKTETEVHHDDTEIEKGFPLSIVMYPSILYKECLINMFKDSPEVQEALKEDPMQEILHTEAKVENYTVLLPKTLPALQQEDALTWKFLKEPPIKRCECNQTINLKLFDDSTQDNVINCLSKWHCLCGKMVSAQTSTTAVRSVDKSVGESAEDDTGHPLPLYSVPSTTDIDHRLVLEPGDLVRCKFAFTPETEGNFFLKRFVQVSGWPQSRVSVKASGLCDLPRIDSRPKKMFRDFVRSSVEGQEAVYKHTYLDDRKLFHFGPIFIGSKRVYEESYTIKLRNSSLMIDEIGIEFTEDTDVFKVDESLITIEAGMRAQVKISAAPTAAGEHRATLLFCIRDNPEIVSVDVACTGVTPVIEILPLSNAIDYGKLLLYRRKDDRFVIKNESMLPVMWKIRNAEELEDNYTMSLKSGTVRRYDNTVVTVTYMASKVGVAKIPLVIDIYQSEGRGEPLLSRTISLSAECYDVQVQIAYEDDATHYLDYGHVKVNSTEVREVTLLNRGKYNIYFKLKKVSKFPEPMLLKSMRASPQTGVLLPSLKPTRIEFECTPKTKASLHNVPAYTCLLLDGGKDQVIVAEFPICMTIASFYNTFSLYPLGELNFGVISMGTSVTREVILTNTSKCPFTYTLIVPEQNIVEVEVPKSRTGTPKSPVSTKGKDNKIKNPPIKCGNFTISNDVNLLAPGASRALQVSFFAEEAQKYEETVQFIISDTCPAEADGVPLRLVGIGAIPSLDFWNLDNTFREQMILKDLSDYDNCETTPHCVFVEDSVTLHFLFVIVGSKYVATIDLYNNGLVPCALAMKLLYQSNSNAEIFSLDRNEAHIEPLTHKNLDIIFTPKALEEYRAVLEIRLKLNEKESQLYTLCIIGEGHIPRIQFTSPTMTAFKLGELSFPVTCLGSVTDAGVEFENVSRVPCAVTLVLEEEGVEDRRVFWMTSCAAAEPAVLAENNDDVNYEYILKLLPAEAAKIIVHYNPLRKGKSNSEVKISIADNPYENYTVVCSAEAFIEDVVLIGLEMLPPDLEPFDTDTTISAAEPSKKAERKEKKDRKTKKKKQKNRSLMSTKTSDMVVGEPTLLKYLLDFGACEVAVMHRRTVVMANNSDKLYKFTWRDAVFLLVKPSSGYISPGEEKDLEIVYLSPEPVILMKELLECSLVAVNDEDLAMEIKDPAWDNQQCAVEFEHDGDLGIIERQAQITPEKEVFPIGARLTALNIAILYSAITEYAKYKTNLEDKIHLADIFIYESKTFEFNVENIGDVPMRIAWRFHIDEHFPTRIDKNIISELTVNLAGVSETAVPVEEPEPESQDKPADESRVTLFSGSVDRESADTWFEADQPFSVAPSRACIPPQKLETFTVKFSPLEAFEYRVRLTSDIDNLDTQDQNLSCRIKARSLIPYIHLDVEESDYLTSGRRKGGKELPEHTTVLEFNVLGSGCYKKSLNVVNPTVESYEYLIESVLSDESELVPMHCNKLKEYVEGGSSSEVTFTFVPTAPGVYESLWKVYLPAKSIELDMLVVGIVREAKVTFVPCNLLIKNSMIGFTSSDTVVLRNSEMEELKFEFKGNSLLNESGKTSVVVQPPEGILKPCSDTPIRIVYTPTKDGPLTFKIHCKVTHMSRPLVLCVNALSYSIQPTVTYKMKDYQHTLNPEAITSIHFDQTASTYERTIPFTIKNEGSATFCYNWRYACSSVKKYLSVEVGPRSGHVAPAEEAECVLRFELKKVPVESFPVTLNITDGPIYNILLHAEIEKPKYRFSNINNMEHDFGKCIVNAPDDTYKKTFLIFNDDQKDLFLSCTFSNTPDLFVHIHSGRSLAPGDSGKVSMYFRPKAVQLYEFKLSFWLNTLCEEVVTIKGEGVQLLFDLYEGCQKTFDLGPVKVGEKVVKEIEVMNYSEVAIEAFLDFKSIYPTIEDDDVSSQGTSICLCPEKSGPVHESPVSRVDNLKRYNTKKVDEQMAKDNQRALSSLKVVPKRVLLKPHTKMPIKIYFKPVGLINNFDVQLHMAVLSTNKPLVRLQGSATDMCLCLSQESLQFGTVRKKGCKVMKLMLMNKGDFGTRFWWQPLITGEFTISPMHGSIEARANVTFTITYRPKMHNPFVKVWACCVIERFKQLEVAMFAACMDSGAVQTQTLYFHAPVRETVTEQVTVVNPSYEPWLVLSEMTGNSGCFETPNEFNIEPNSKYLIPITFKPRVMGVAEEQVLFAPLGDQSLMLKLVGVGEHPKPNEVIDFEVPAKDRYTLDLNVYNITEVPETYTVFSEVVKTVPDKFDGLYELKYPREVRVWGDAAARCPWSVVCYGTCTMQIKVMFVNEDTKEYQYYTINATVTRSDIVDTIHLVAIARDTAQREISVTNPLSHDIDFRVTSPSLRVPDTITVPQRARVLGETEELLEIQHPLVGSCVYRMMLSCLPGKVKRVAATCPLGASVPLRLRVQNRKDVKTEFTATTSDPCIVLDKKYVLSPLEKGKFVVWFEPTQLGEVTCEVTFYSRVAGKYVFAISGVGTTPQPRGPYSVPVGAATYIHFKNVFDETKTFQINVDAPEFTVDSNLEQIDAKEEIKVAVHLSSSVRGADPLPSGSLSIECCPPEPPLAWTYFLQGVP
ncbi:hypothetical protein JYU34_002397 [Plutella xylostella]|nr:hypothetical protein JYU34_002397 [Plutella xylostella]